MSESPVETCSICGAGPVEKLLFPVAVHFKGSGFYSTDYGKGRRKAAKDGGDSGGSSTTSSETSDKSTTEKPSGDKKKPAADSG